MTTPEKQAASGPEGYRHWIGGGASFVVGRGSVFLFPLALAASVPVEQYGQFEFALAIAGMLAIACDGGVSGALVYFILRRRKPGALPAASLYAAIVQAAALALAAILYFRGTKLELLVCLLVAILVGQGVCASRFRVSGRPRNAFIFDSLLYSTGLLLVIGAWIGHVPPSVDGLVTAWCLTAIALLAIHVRIARSARGPIRHQVRRLSWILAFGRTLIVNSFLASALVLLGRGLSGYVLGDTAAAIFGFYFRLASITLVMHGFLQTMLFKDLYGMSPERSAALLLRILGAVAGAAAILLVAFGVLFSSTTLFAGFHPRENFGLLILFSSTVVAWSATAQQELLINQERLAPRMVRALCGVLLVFLGTVFAFHRCGILSVGSLAALHGIAMLAYLIAQGRLLRARGIRIEHSVLLVALAALVGQAANAAW